MAKEDRKYWIVERGTNNAPLSDPVLVDSSGNEVNLSNPANFNKAGNLKKVDHYRIRFEIKEFRQSPLRFAPNETDVLWTKEGGGAGNCPTTACHDLKYEFWVDDMDRRGEWIDAINMDLVPRAFWFTLNLVDKNNVSGPFVPVDPPGDNQNGGNAGSFTFSWIGVITCGFVGAVVSISAAATVNPLDAPAALAYGIGGAVAGLILGAAGFAFARN